jgi:hypothetical protein
LLSEGSAALELSAAGTELVEEGTAGPSGLHAVDTGVEDHRKGGLLAFNFVSLQIFAVQ